MVPIVECHILLYRCVVMAVLWPFHFATGSPTTTAQDEDRHTTAIELDVSYVYIPYWKVQFGERRKMKKKKTHRSEPTNHPVIQFPNYSITKINTTNLRR